MLTNHYSTSRTNKLSIAREYWPDVTETPHFIVNLTYEGCNLVHDDIYFNNVPELINRLEALERDRKGAVNLDGGCRFNAIVEATLTGAMQLKFTAESSNDFPGKLRLEGFFSIGGEEVTSLLGSLIDLLKNGKPFNIA